MSGSLYTLRILAEPKPANAFASLMDCKSIISFKVSRVTPQGFVHKGDIVMATEKELRNTTGTSLVHAEHFRKVYYPTVAVADISLDINKGDILALVGANGAGKSTLTKALSGVINCDSGELWFDGKQVDLANYNPAVARDLGIRVVHQELSLCKNLTVYENFYIEQSQSMKGGLSWRNKARAMAREALDRVFPGNDIDVNSGLEKLSIAQQQMVEIARATSDKNTKLMILDEPTSSLPMEQTEQLQDYLMQTAKEGMTYIYISHRLNEIMTIANRVFIMQNGNEKWKGGIEETSEEHMVKMMGEGIGSGDDTIEKLDDWTAPELNREISVTFSHYTTKRLKDVSLAAYGGQIVGLTGLEGNGQLDIIRDIFEKAKKNVNGLKVNGKVAYVAGDRKKEGIFPLWSIEDNQVITKAAGCGLLKHLSKAWLAESVGYWYDKLHIKSDSKDALITSLSGGNQQKVLIARALVADADIILLDDPTRGVDQPTKNALYEVLREAASAGKLVIWRTSDDAELNFCTNLFVLNTGHVVGEFEGDNVEHEKIMSLAFKNMEDKKKNTESKKEFKAPLFTFALIAMIVIYGVCASRSPLLLSSYGIQLMVTGFAALMLCALSQTFTIGLSHVDLGVGNYCGLINVLICTYLFEKPLMGLVLLILALAAYPLMGYVIQKRNVPAIIVTLGASFVWTGLALSIQSMPGGKCPVWIRTLLYTDTSFVNIICFWLIVLLVAAILIYRSRYGTVLRGFGNNESAMINSGWSRTKAYMSVYLFAGIFAMLAGFCTSAINNASDASASSTYTMLSVASVIIGGGYFSGGVVTHFGAVCGAISLTMISVLLGLFKVSTDYTASIQGLVLILILSLRLLKGREKKS